MLCACAVAIFQGWDHLQKKCPTGSELTCWIRKLLSETSALVQQDWFFKLLKFLNTASSKVYLKVFERKNTILLYVRNKCFKFALTYSLFNIGSYLLLSWIFLATAAVDICINIWYERFQLYLVFTRDLWFKLFSKLWVLINGLADLNQGRFFINIFLYIGSISTQILKLNLKIHL